MRFVCHRHALLLKKGEVTVCILWLKVYLPGDCLIDAGSEGQAMYFIQEGQVNVFSSSGEFVSTLTGGDYFGEMAMVRDEHKTTATVQAKDYCDMYKLERADFYSVFEGHPEVLAQIKAVTYSKRSFP